MPFLRACVTIETYSIWIKEIRYETNCCASGAVLSLYFFSGCGLISDITLAEPEPAPPSVPEQEAPPEEPEGSKALTLIFAHEMDDGRTDLLEAAEQIAEEKGYTLSTVTALGDPVLQERFIELARDAGEQAILIELADRSTASAAVQQAGEMAVIFIDTMPEDNSALSKHAIYVGNQEGEGELYLRLTGRTALRAADNLIRNEPADTETELKLSGHKIMIPADGMIETE